MKVDYSERAGKSLQNLPPGVRKEAFRQMRFLEQNLGHPSLRAKKYDESIGLWQARVNLGWRFYFTIERREYRLHEIKPHPK